MRSFLKIALLSSVLVCSADVFAQTTQIYLPNTTPPEVWAYGRLQPLAWSGGLNNPQICMADLNNDGIKDMAIYDRVGRFGSVKTFINTSSIPGNPKYEYRPEYQINFPLIADYMKMEDYNRDGIPDLFHKGMGGVSVYKGYYQNNKLNFTFYRELRYNLPGSGLVNCYVAPIDIPAIVDVDNDQDLDVLSYDVMGTRISYFRNCEKEDGLPKDSMRMCYKSTCWGKTVQFYERKLLLGDTTCDKFSFGTTCKTTHAGNTLLLLDYDGDGDMDAFNGNVSYSDIQFLKNGRVEYSYNKDTIISQDTMWGGANGKIAYMSMMPLANYIDVDNDGKKDLIISPRLDNTENYKSIAYYKNNGTTALPNFSYVSDTLFMQDMIDAGSAAIPVMYDYNKDGKLDMFIANEGYYQANGTLRARISYYENTSTTSKQSFELKNNDFMGFWASNLRHLALSFGDMNGDGIDDMLLGRGDGNITFFRNTAASNTVTPVYTTPMILNDLSGTIDVGDYATPFIYDVDKDGKNDIVSGNQAGNIIYYRNTGTTPVPVFNKITDSLGGVRVVEEGSIYTYTVPFIGKIDNSNKDYLLIGTQGGTIYRYDSVVSGNITKYNRLDSNYCYINIHQRSAPYVADIDGDGKKEMMIGGYAGGVVMFKQYFNVGIDNVADTKNKVDVYPNPANNQITIAWKDGFANGNVEIKLVSVTGQVVKQLTVAGTNTSALIDVSNLSNGIYYCIVQSAGNQSVVPVSIIK
ncbi:hypothetical protein CAP35_11580 [Chitinophagaceae bacterium IBVUCB1]|nr:hypothetical protein CAP35_11580 [Chitinophagaceae bacterium IBVUCB1]